VSSVSSPEAGSALALPGGGYRLVHMLGRGAYGEVWRAEAPGGIEVAVKIIRRDLQPRRRRPEHAALELLRRLRNHYLLSVHAFFPLPDRLVVVMELADANLRQRLQACEAGPA